MTDSLQMLEDELITTIRIRLLNEEIDKLKTDISRFTSILSLCTLRADACNIAAERGDLVLLQLVRAKGCPWNETTCACAAKGGNLEVLKWLRAEGCPWDELTCIEAVEAGHLNVLEWARENGAPWNLSLSY